MVFKRLSSSSSSSCTKHPLRPNYSRAENTPRPVIRSLAISPYTEIERRTEKSSSSSSSRSLQDGGRARSRCSDCTSLERPDHFFGGQANDSDSYCTRAIVKKKKKRARSVTYFFGKKNKFKTISAPHSTTCVI